MSDKLTEEIKLTSPYENRWWNFYQEANELDFNKDKPHGWHWFWGLNYIYNRMGDGPFFEISEIQRTLPDWHWLQKIDGSILKNIHTSKEQEELISVLENHFTEGERLSSLIDFSKLHFEESAYFTDLIFPLPVSFEYTRFSGDTAFNNVKFFRLGHFGNTHFIDRVSFNRASFPMLANFEKTIFYGAADFYKANLSRTAMFKEATFSSLANFSKADISGNANFIGTQFKTLAPYLHDAKIGTGILWDKDINLWPQIKKDADNETDGSYKYRMVSNQNNYENLTSHMKKLDKYHDEHFFFREAMRCQRQLEHPLIRPFYWLYEKLADYGYGVGHAFCWWLGHITLGVFVIAIIALCGGLRFHESLPCAISLSFTNANPYAFFGFDSSGLKACYTKLDMLAPISFAIVKVIQTILGVGSLFLLLNTLRIRFRLK